LRGGNAASARGAASLVAEAIGAAQDAGCAGIVVVRADSAYYGGAFVAAVPRSGWHGWPSTWVRRLPLDAGDVSSEWDCSSVHP
jgi:hypothetical protein